MLRCRSLLAANNGNAAGHSCDERHILRDLVDPDPHRNALRETNPGEYRIDVRQALRAACGVRGTDAARDALNPAANRGFISKQYRLDAVSDMDVGELRFLELGVDPIGIFVDHRDAWRAGTRIVAHPHQKVRDVTIDRRTNLRPLQIDLGLR